MNMGAISLIFSLLSLAIQIQLFPGEAKQIEIRNNCSFTVWPASSLSSLSHSSLKNQETLVVDLPTSEDGRLWVWGRTGCHNSTGKFVCQTGDCGSGLVDCAGVPTRGLNATTLVEFNFINGGGFYDVSLVNGYNVPVSAETGSLSDVAGCVFNVSGACPKQLKLGGACRSACNVFNTPKYCCTGGGTLCGPTDYSRIFKERCPRAYSYLLDVANSTRSGKYLRYVVTFCPSSASVIRELSKPFQEASLNPPRSAPPPNKTNITGIPHAQPPSTNFAEKKRRRLPSSVLVAVPTSVAILIFLLLGTWKCMKKRKAVKKCHEELDEIKTTESLEFDISTIRTATDNFSMENKLGEGGFGEVYRGKLESGQEVAVKRLLQNSSQGVAEFETEVLLVAKLQHKNLVKLLGFCITSKEKILVYEFLRNSSLDKFLFDRTGHASLDWQTRFNIIVGIARGLLYLHEDSRLTIIHRDLKTSNILLDDVMNPKISDFGLAKLFEEDQTQANTKRIVGTYGYMAPEYALTGHYSVKSDVFSFGVIVLEIISGQRNRFFGRPQHEEALLHRAWRLWTEKKPLDLLDTTLINGFPEEETIRCLHIGLLCIQEDAVQRPKMRLILNALRRTSVRLPEPKPPCFFGIANNLEDHHNPPHIYTGTGTITHVYPR